MGEVFKSKGLRDLKSGMCVDRSKLLPPSIYLKSNPHPSGEGTGVPAHEPLNSDRGYGGQAVYSHCT